MPRYTPYSSVAPSRSASSDPRSPRIPTIATPLRNVTFGRSIRRSLHYNSYEDVAAFSPLSSPFTNVLTSPVSPLGTAPSGAPIEQLSSSRVNKAIENATIAISKAEASIAEVNAMRDQQARFVSQQESVLTMLELESDKLDNELQDLQRELVKMEDEIAQLKTPQAPSDLKGVKQSVQYKLRYGRSKI
ncbi:hypothetical protein SCHPADRAFT_740994 [Schizopora paradoxa]|uniref:GDP/GTP exchange factor Sec2 N-terminal domain-containing protein n=1 Tax=Schizopora paradoxa TaxID=27342 RepID=A0A0H2R104_9AGAM|nr:hypothetical protein SCHPADRAFT_740994 [Schizopora paradoxa]